MDGGGGHGCRQEVAGPTAGLSELPGRSVASPRSSWRRESVRDATPWRNLTATSAGAQTLAMASGEDNNSARLPRRSTMARAGPGGICGMARVGLGGWMARRPASAFLPSEPYRIPSWIPGEPIYRVCWIDFLTAIPSKILIQSSLPSLCSYCIDGKWGFQDLRSGAFRRLEA